MKYLLDNRHREFYAQYGWIEFEALLTPEEVSSLNSAIDLTIQRRLKTSKFSQATEEEEFLARYDLSRASDAVKKVCGNRNFAQMASDLVEIKPLRLAFDQVYVHTNQPTISAKRITLDSYFPFQGLACGLLLCLNSVEQSGSKFFPTAAGSGSFISPTLSIDIASLNRTADQRYLLIGYGKVVTLFVQRDSHALNMALKQLGYHYGDKLKDGTHPIIQKAF